MADRAEIGVFGGSNGSDERTFAIQKLAQVVLVTNNVDSCNRT
jgi:predicted molibdopterin-dependent oxidoreductase YjgC